MGDPMWRGILILIVISFLWPLSIAAKEVLVGTVVSVDRENGDVVIRPIGSPAEEKDITMKIPSGGLPGYVKPGATLRIWGTAPGPTHGFIPQRFTAGDPRRPMADPTGVRQRLMNRPPSPAPNQRPPAGRRR